MLERVDETPVAIKMRHQKQVSLRVNQRLSYLGFCLVGVSSIALLLLWIGRPVEPVYQGQSPAYWADQLWTAEPADQQIARNALREIGPQAIPFLLARMRDEQSLFRCFYRMAYARLPSSIRRGLPNPRPEIFGLRARTLQAIGAIGPSSIPRLVRVLRDRDSQIRWIATAGIGMVGHGLDGPVAALIPLAKDPDQSVRAVAIHSLGRLGPANKAAIPVVVDALQNAPSRQVRSAAAWALLGIAPDAAGSVLGAWRGALADPDPNARQWAAIGLWRDTGDSRMISFLIGELVVAPDDESWQRILPVLGQAGEVAKSAAPIFAAKLAELEKTGSPSPEGDLAVLIREVFCQTDEQAAQRVQISSP